MDDLDRRLVALLRGDARTPLATLAKQLKVSRGTVQNRLRRMETDGTIIGYTLSLKQEVEEHRMRAITTIAVEGSRATGVLKALRGDPAVVALHTTNGRWDIVAELRVETLQEFDQLLTRIRSLDGVVASETSLLLAAVKA
jgi:DNA-binding Lrp family transcriptional regulator